MPLSILSMIEGRLFSRSVSSCDQYGYCLDFPRGVAMGTGPLRWWNRDGKVNLTFRIYSSAWHVYAELAILNPSARTQIHQYAKSAS